MNKNEEVSADLVQSIWKFFASLRLTLIVLLSLAVTSVIGTLIPQNESPAAYFRAYGEFLYRLFDVLDLFDMYHSWWFQVLLLLLTANVLVCSVDRLSVMWRVIFVGKPSYSVERFRRQKNRREFFIDRTPDRIRKDAARIAGRRFGRMKVEDGPGGFVLFAERWRWSRLGVYIVHLSVILLLVGGLVGSIFGFEGYVNIPEGEAVDTIRLRNSGRMVSLPFSIRCDDFSVSFYKSGQPKEFRSRLTLLKDGKTLAEKDILVNHPLRYGGINIFQSSYGELDRPSPPARREPVKSAVITFTSRQSGMVYEERLDVGDSTQIPEGGGTFRLESYEPSAVFMGQPIGEALKARLFPPEGEPVQVLLPFRFANFDKMRKGDFVIAVAEVAPKAEPLPIAEKRYYTGLQVTKDPGVGVVYTGFVLIILGCFVTFFMAHQQICVEATAEKGGSRVAVAGTANRNRLSMGTRVERLTERLEEALNRTET